MTNGKWAKYKELLLEHKRRILNYGMLTKHEDLVVDVDDLFDEADLANSVVQQQVTFNIREREVHKLRAIDEALARIEAGTYGECEDCGEAISEKRLTNAPWTSLCITHAEERERDEYKSPKSA